MKKTNLFILFLCGTLSLFVGGCTKDQDPMSNKQKYDIYVAGNNDGYATYWKNGAAFVNENVKGDYFAIAVENGDVYTLCNSGGKYSYYKNNETPVMLTGGTANSITVSNGNVYVTGYIPFTSSSGDRAVYWLNGVLNNLNAGGGIASQSYSTSISDGNVYIAGYINYRYSGGNIISGAYSSAVYWKNGSLVTLTGGWGNNAQAHSIYVSGNDIHIAGFEQISGGVFVTYWENGTPYTFNDINTSDLSTCASAIAVSANGDVHIVSDYYNFGYKYTYWKNGIETDLNIYKPQKRLRLAVAGNDVYITGGFSDGKYLKNGKLEDFTDTTGGVALAITTVSH